GAQPHDPEVLVAERDRLARPPLQVGDRAQVDEDHLAAERALEPERQREEGRQDRQVLRGGRVAPPRGGGGGLAVLFAGLGLVVAHDELAAELRVGGALAGDAAGELARLLVGALDDVEEQDPHGGRPPSRKVAGRKWYRGRRRRCSRLRSPRRSVRSAPEA